MSHGSTLLPAGKSFSCGERCRATVVVTVMEHCNCTIHGLTILQAPSCGLQLSCRSMNGHGLCDCARHGRIIVQSPFCGLQLSCRSMNGHGFCDCARHGRIIVQSPLSNFAVELQIDELAWSLSIALMAADHLRRPRCIDACMHDQKSIRRICLRSFSARAIALPPRASPCDMVPLWLAPWFGLCSLVGMMVPGSSGGAGKGQGSKKSERNEEWEMVGEQARRCQEGW